MQRLPSSSLDEHGYMRGSPHYPGPRLDMPAAQGCSLPPIPADQVHARAKVEDPLTHDCNRARAQLLTLHIFGG